MTLDVPVEDREREEDHAEPDSDLIEHLLCTSALHIGGSGAAERGTKARRSVLQQDRERKENRDDNEGDRKHMQRVYLVETAPTMALKSSFLRSLRLLFA